LWGSGAGGILNIGLKDLSQIISMNEIGLYVCIFYSDISFTFDRPSASTNMTQYFRSLA